MPRVRSHCRFRKRGTEHVSDSGINWTRYWYKSTMRASPSRAVEDRRHLDEEDEDGALGVEAGADDGDDALDGEAARLRPRRRLINMTSLVAPYSLHAAH